MKRFPLAQVNIGRFRAPVDHPMMEGFRTQRDPINALADKSPGFVPDAESDTVAGLDAVFCDGRHMILCDQRDEGPMQQRVRSSFRSLLAPSLAAVVAMGCSGRAAQSVATPNAGGRAQRLTVEGAWQVVQTAARASGATWTPRPGPQAGLYVFSARHYSYFYVPGVQPRARFVDGNRPTEAEKATAYDTFIAGAGTYTFDGETLVLEADLRKNPNEATGESWRWQATAHGDTLRLVFANPPFLPGQEWRVTLVRAK